MGKCTYKPLWDRAARKAYQQMNWRYEVALRRKAAEEIRKAMVESIADAAQEMQKRRLNDEMAWMIVGITGKLPEGLDIDSYPQWPARHKEALRSHLLNHLAKKISGQWEACRSIADLRDIPELHKATVALIERTAKEFSDLLKQYTPEDEGEA